MPLPGWDNGNNQAAATLASAGENLRNYLYQQAVQKPAIQAQTAATTAGTAQTQAQTQLLKQQMTSGQMQQNAAKLQILRESLFSPDQDQATDTSTQGNAPQSSTTPGVTTGAMGAGSSGSSPGSMSSPVLPNTQPPNQAGSSTQGASSESGLSAPKPGTGNSAGVPQATSDTTQANLKFAGFPTLPPLSGAELNDHQAVRSPAGTSIAGAAPSTGTPATPPPTGLSTTPSLTPPVSPAANIRQPDILAPALGQTYDRLTPEQQAEVLRRGHSKLAGAGFGGFISDAGMVKEWNEQQQSTVPLAQRPASSVVTTGEVPLAGGGTGKLLNPAAAQTIGGSDLPEGSYRDVYTGEIKTDPNHALPAEAAETQNTLSSISQLRQKVADARAAIGRTTGPATAVVGGGSAVQEGRHWVREGESAAASLSGGIIGKTIPAQDESTLGQFTSGQFINSLGALKGIGRMDIPVVEGVKGGILTAAQPPEIWEKYLDTVDKALSDKEKIVTNELGKQTRGTKTTLPPVDITGQKVNMVKNADGTWSAPPASSSAPAKSSLPVMQTPEEAKQKLAPGTWFQTPQGVPRQLH